LKALNVKAHIAAAPKSPLPTQANMARFGGGTPINRQAPPVDSLGSLRRQTLVALRWGAIIGQLLALLVVSQFLGFDYPLIACGLTIFASIIVNLVVTLSLPLDRRVSDFEAYMQLGFDIWQLSGLLWLTGGITNPFSILFLAPVVTAATTLSRWVVFALGTMALTLSLALVFFHQPLPWSPQGSFDLPWIYKIGIWMAIFVGSIFTSLYAWRTTNESRKMTFALAATEARLAEEQKLTALGGLAAAAAHELGTPLATIQVVAKEMSREVDAGSPLGEDAALILSQSQRCRDILEQLSQRGDEGDMIHDVLAPEDLLEEVAEPFIEREKDIVIRCHGAGPEPVLKRQAELLYALKNYIDNAVDFAASRVELSAVWDMDKLNIFIDDDGKGFDSTLKSRLGQPYASTRKRSKTAGGLGLGVFISGRLIERTGGSVSYARSPLGGARIKAEWPRSARVIITQMPHV
jgi:two-component system sensor histidine kinase RegB